MTRPYRREAKALEILSASRLFRRSFMNAYVHTLATSGHSNAIGSPIPIQLGVYVTAVPTETAAQRAVFFGQPRFGLRRRTAPRYAVLKDLRAKESNAKDPIVLRRKSRARCMLGFPGPGQKPSSMELHVAMAMRSRTMACGTWMERGLLGLSIPKILGASSLSTRRTIVSKLLC